MKCPVCQIELSESYMPMVNCIRMFRDCKETSPCHFISTWMDHEIISYYLSWINEKGVEYNLKSGISTIGKNQTTIYDPEKNIIFETKEFFLEASIKLIQRLINLKAFS